MKNVTYIVIFFVLLFLFVYISIQAKEVIKPKPVPKPVEPREMRYIKVTYPNGNESWKVGDTYNIRWESNGVQGNVKIILQLASSSSYWFPVVNNTPNSGSFYYTVPSGLTFYGDKFKVIVMTLDEAVKDESNNQFIILKEIDLNVSIKDVECNPKGNGFIVKFRIGIINEGTRILNPVLFEWIINAYGGYLPTEFISQSGAGWSNVYPGRWYESDLMSVEIPESKLGHNRKILIEAYVDPKNNWNEPSWTRDNNKEEKIIDPYR